MEQRKISQIINKMPYELNKEERKIQIVCFLTFSIIPCLIFSYIWFGLLMKLNFILFSFTFYFVVVGISVMIYYWDELDAKYKLRSVKSSLSYQFQVIFIAFISPMFLLGMLFLGLASGNFLFGLGGAIALFYPILGMFIRIKTFNDGSMTFSRKVVIHDVDRKRSSGVPKAALPNIKENSREREFSETVKGFGYMPFIYWLLSAMLGLYTTGSGFSDIYLHFTKGFPSLEAAIFTIILGLLVQSVYLFPDKLNKIVPIELRSKNGFWFMVVLVFVLFGVSQFLIGVVTGLTG